MRRTLFGLIILLGVPAYSLGQATSTDTQTLQALLNEVRSLRQELRVSLNRSQSMQILLARFQIQEGVITRASDRLNEARQKLLETRTGQKQLANELKRLEDALNTAALPQQQAELQDRMKHVKSDLEIIGNTEQQQQATETRAEQQLREEQDKLNLLENQLDQLLQAMGNTSEKSSASHP
jgi:chromosome segregation ATPase